jgi:SAM-dependent methyltransferase
MYKIEYTKMSREEDTYFWFLGKRYFVDSILSGYKSKIHKILDLGSGTGGMTKHMEKYGDVTGIENYDYAIKLARSRGLNIKKGDLNKFKINDNSFDLVTIFDVLYHKNIKDDGVLIKKAYKSLKTNGYLLITDSALGFLKSNHDIVTQGRKRYSLSEMVELVEEQNFMVVKASYIFFSIFPLILIKRLILDKITGSPASDDINISPILNKILLIMIFIESKLLQYLSLPIGSSVLVLAIKK